MREGNSTIRAVSYARLSVNRNGDTLAIERQEEDALALIAHNGWTLIGQYSDNGRSAWHEHSHRPGFEALCDAIRSGLVDVVVVYEVDRLARRLRGLLDFMDLLMNSGVVVHTVKSGLMRLDSPMEIANAQMKAVFAEQYINDARDKNLRARRQKAELGHRHMTARPFGWEADGYTLRPDEATVIREMCERIIGGETPTTIARDFNRRGITTIGGSEWLGRSIRACARRASNAALRSHNGAVYKGCDQWQPIISREQWEQVCRVLDRPSTTYKRGSGRKYWLVGFAYCAVCGSQLTAAMGRSNAGEPAYRCDYKKSHEASPTGCGKVQRNLVTVDWYIKEMLIRRLEDDGLHQALSQAYSDDETMQQLIREATDKQERLDAIIEDYASGVLTRAQFTKAKGIADAELERVNRHISELQGSTSFSKVDFSTSIRQTVEEADVHTMQVIAEALIKRVTIAPQNKTGWKVKTVEVDGKKRRFDADLVTIEWA